MTRIWIIFIMKINYHLLFINFNDYIFKNNLLKVLFVFFFFENLKLLDEIINYIMGIFKN